MKSATIVYKGLGIVVGGWATAASAMDFSHYQVILDRNPFGEIAPLPSAAADMTAESFAKDYEMKGIIDDGEKLQVCILDKKANKHIYLDIGQELGGMQLVSVNYDQEEAVLKMGDETAVVKLHPSKNKPNEAASPSALASAASSLGMSRPSADAESTALPFGQSSAGGARRPFFPDMRRRGVSPFQRLGTNAAFQPKSLESFFKPNTNVSMPFISPFRPLTSPANPADATVAPGQGVQTPTFPFTPLNVPAQGSGIAQPSEVPPQILPSQGDTQIPTQPVVVPLTVPMMDYGTGGGDE